MAISYKSSIGKEDIKWWDGKDTTFTRETSTGGTVTLTKYGHMVDVAHVYGNGSINADILASAITAIGTNNVTLLIVPGTWTIGSDITIPSNCALYMPQGAVFNIAAGKTLTINGVFQTGLYQVFSGDGNVVFNCGAITEVKPEWFGAVGDGVTDDSISFIKTIYSVKDSIKRIAVHNFYNIANKINAYSCDIIGYNHAHSGFKCSVANDVILYDVSNVHNCRFIGNSSSVNDGIQIVSYKNNISNCYFNNLKSAIVTGYLCIVTIERCEFLSCDTAIDDRMVSGDSAHTTLHFYNNVVHNGNKAFNFTKDLSGFGIVSNVFEDLMYVFDMNSHHMFDIVFMNNWVEQIYKDCTIFYDKYQATNIVTIANCLRPNSRVITDADMCTSNASAVVSNRNILAIDNYGCLVSAPPSGIGFTYRYDGIYPSALMANYGAPNNLIIQTMQANSNYTAQGGALKIKLGTGSNGQPHGDIILEDTSSNNILGVIKTGTHGTKIYHKEQTGEGNNVKDSIVLESRGGYWNADIALARIILQNQSSTGGSGSAYGYICFETGTSGNGDGSPQMNTVAYVDMVGINPYSSNSYDLGSTTLPWRNIYLNNSPVIVSDERLKEIFDIDDAEKECARELKRKLIKFKYKDSNDTQYHFGISAQEVERTFLKFGLNPKEYGVIVYTEWYEAENGKIVVDKDQQCDQDGFYVEREVDEQGNVIKEEKFNVVKKDRYNVRYDELFAFILMG